MINWLGLEYHELYEIPLNKVFPGNKVFWLHDTHGFPTMASACECVDRGMCIDWATYIIAAHKQGWKDRKIKLTIIEAIQDAGYNKAFMDKHFKLRENV